MTAVRLERPPAGAAWTSRPAESVDGGFIVLELDKLEKARVSLNAGRRITEELDAGCPAPSYQAARAVELFIAGDWDDAIAEAKTGVGLADERRQAHRRILGRSVLSLVSLHRNDLSCAEDAADVTAAELAETGPQARVWAVWAHALVLEARGEITRALAELAGCWNMGAQRGLTLESRVVGPDLVRLALVAGDIPRARKVSARVAELAARYELASLAAASLRCLGLTEDDPAILLDAAEAHADRFSPLEQALACEDAGAAFARQGHADRGRSLLEHAVQIYQRLDARRDIARTEALLRGAGIRRGSRGLRNRPQVGWRSLTPAEHAVASLVAEGLSNPQIGHRLYVSPRTVQTHLAHVFAKLDIASRVQLAVEVTRHRGNEPDEGTGLA